MLSGTRMIRRVQTGLGLPEIMIAMAIGLITTLVIMQVMTNVEGQKRTTTGNADAQTSGSIALYTIQRQAQLAGYGLPIFSANNPPLNCSPEPTIPFDHDGDAVTPAINIGIFPVVITDGADGASDTITLRSGTSPMGGIPITITNVVAATNSVFVTNTLGCAAGDFAIVANGSNCVMSSTTAVASNTEIQMQSVAGMDINASVACMGGWSETSYAVANGNLTENSRPGVSGIVSIQAQYGISAAPASNNVVQWVDAAGPTWAAPDAANRLLIKAIRVAVVARNGLLEKENVTEPCSSLIGEYGAKELCAWQGDAANPAPAINLSADPLWRRYRYRVFDTIIPLRNLMSLS